MRKRHALLAAAAALAAAALLYVRAAGTDPAGAIRRLSGLRLAAEFFRLSERRAPASFGEVLKAGKLEAVPRLKLPRHLPASKVRDVPALRITDSGGWAYVNAPASPDFGLVFIDCSHTDPKGRYWSEF